MSTTARHPAIPAVAVDRRIARAAVATLVIGGYTALGFAFRLGAEAYLLLGIPITIAFQALVVRAPLRSLWLRQAPPPVVLVALLGGSRPRIDRPGRHRPTRSATRSPVL